MVRGARGCFWGSISILCTSAGSAAAEPTNSPLTLWWEPTSTADCPSGDVVLAEVERLLGGKPSTGTNRRLFARAKVSAGPDGAWELTLRTVLAGADEEADGERTLRAPSCEDLASAAALIVALGFDPAAVAEQAKRAALSPSPGAATDRAPTPAPPKRAEAAAQDRSSAEPPGRQCATPPPRRAESVAPARVRPGVWLGGGADLGSFSAPAYALEVRAGFRYQRLQLAATAAYYPPQSIPLPERPAAGGTFTLIAGGLLACSALRSFRAGSLELAACGGAEIGQMHAEGFGVISPGSADGLWLAARAGAALTAALTEVAGLRLDLGLAVPIARNRFYLENAGTVYEPGYLCGRADIGVEMHF